jgi:lysophospholipase L1-like esterase
MTIFKYFSFIKKQITTGLILAVNLALAEILAGGLYKHVTPLMGRRVIGLVTGNSADKEDFQPRFQKHPYMLYTNTVNWVDGEGILQNNSLGYRGGEIAPTPRPGVFRILALGDSTTYGWGIQNPADAWPAQLEQRFNEIFPNYSIEVVNGGLPNATTTEVLGHYIFRDRYLGAKMVIIHIPGNDVRAQVLDNYHPEYTHFRHNYLPPVLSLRKGEQLLLKSNLVKTGYAWWLSKTISTDKIWDEEHWQNVSPEKAVLNAQANSAGGFRRNLDLLVQNIIQDGLTPVIFPFVFAAEEKSRETLSDYYPAAAIAVEKNNQIAKEIAGKYQIPLVELPTDLVPSTGFIDHCHLNPEGDQAKAYRLAEALDPLLQTLLADQ